MELESEVAMPMAEDVVSYDGVEDEVSDDEP